MAENEIIEDLRKRVFNIEYQLFDIKSNINEITEYNRKMVKYQKAFYIFLLVSIVISIITSLIFLVLP